MLLTMGGKEWGGEQSIARRRKHQKAYQPLIDHELDVIFVR